MELINSLSSRKSLLLGGLLLGFITIYPNIGYLVHDVSHENIAPSEYTFYIEYFIYRFIFFMAASCLMLYVNIKYLYKENLSKRLQKSFLLIVLIYLVYLGIAFLTSNLRDCFGSTLILQFLVIWLISGLTGHIYILSMHQVNMEKEYEQLKVENLQSRHEALVNQINPHFFFNSLNSLTSLVREDQKKQTLEYINKLSNVFRYIMQSEKKGLVSLEEELHFLEAYRYLLEVRYADKISFHIDIAENNREMKIPVLSLLPLIENIVKHNIIDSQHRMVITVRMNEDKEVVVSNPVHEKTFSQEKTGIGLTNLANRFLLLLDKQIRVESRDGIFYVYLPLTK